MALQAAPIGKPVPADWTVDNQYIFSELHDFAIGENVVVRDGDIRVFGKVVEKRVVSSPAMRLTHAFAKMVWDALPFGSRVALRVCPPEAVS